MNYLSLTVLIIQSRSPLVLVTKLMENSDLVLVTKLFGRLKFGTDLIRLTAGGIINLHERPSFEPDTRDSGRKEILHEIYSVEM